MFCLTVALAALAAADPNLPTVTVSQDDTVITESCRVVIPGETVIRDANGNGVIQIKASDVTVVFVEGAHLRGSEHDARPDSYDGFGVRIVGQQNVILRGLRVSGFRGGVWATETDGLVLEDCDGSDNHRQRLGSTRLTETGRDWLRPHDNESNEWLKYGAAFYVEDARGVTVRRCKAYHGQNALLLDNVNESRVYDNDFSFNSGWGIGMWRSCDNVITRNAIDFCVRGYSHGIYNRGQDSAGILMFEQNSRNVIAENSCTHGGDGIFGFAGNDALGKRAVEPPPAQYERRGNNDNLFIKNDLSYAPAHGYEMTFSFGNRVLANRFHGNAICGIWGGYSQDTLIAHNEFVGNGDAGYGRERGGINIEYGDQNRIVHNIFRENHCAIHLWRDDKESHMDGPWIRDNLTSGKDNLIAGNTFKGDKLVFDFNGPMQVTLGHNTIETPERLEVIERDFVVQRQPDLHPDPPELPDYPVHGKTHPVGARPELRGRENIIMTEWGPWDHQSPLVIVAGEDATSRTYALSKFPPEVEPNLVGTGVAGKLTQTADGFEYVVSATQDGVLPYRLDIETGDFAYTAEAALLRTTWQTTVFNFKPETVENVDAWRQQADGDSAKRHTTDRLEYWRDYSAIGGPVPPSRSHRTRMDDLNLGLIAKTELTIPRGEWEFRLVTDSGARLSVDGKAVIDRWDGRWWGPRYATGRYGTNATKTVEIVVEQYQRRRPAVLSVEVVPVEWEPARQ